MGRSVLVVDDDPLVRHVVSHTLMDAGYEVRTASDGLEALGRIHETRPDILVTDWIMPNLDGIELCRRLREEYFSKNIFAIMLTAKNSPQDLKDGIESGIDDYLCKPVKTDVLLTRLRLAEHTIDRRRELMEMATIDPLTGVPNRATFFEQLEYAINQAHRQHLALSCVMVDIDHFKHVNDVHGHHTGDIALRAVAWLLSNSCRSTDRFCRYGGEEFCVLLPDTKEEDALLWAERARATIESSLIPAGEKSFSLTASFGIAGLPKDLRDPEKFVQLADGALKNAKQAGRNCVHRVLMSPAGKESIGYAEPPQKLFSGRFARDIMVSPILCLHSDETASRAADIFLRMRVTSIPVVDDEGKLVGMISEKELIGLDPGHVSWHQPLGRLMNKHVLSYEEDVPAQMIYDFLCRLTVRRILIVKDGKPTGMVSRGSILRWLGNWSTVFEPTAHSQQSEAQIDQQRHQSRLALRASLEGINHVVGQLNAAFPDLDDVFPQEDFVPTIVDGATKLHELVNDLLAHSQIYNRFSLNVGCPTE